MSTEGLRPRWMRDLMRFLPVATENRIRAGADAAMDYPGFGMLDLLKLLSGLLVGLFRCMRLARPKRHFSAGSLSS